VKPTAPQSPTPSSTSSARCPYPRVVQALCDELGQALSADLIAATVTAEAARFSSVPVHAYLEVLVHKAARTRLKAAQSVPVRT